MSMADVAELRLAPVLIDAGTDRLTVRGRKVNWMDPLYLNGFRVRYVRVEGLRVVVAPNTGRGELGPVHPAELRSF